MTRGSMVCLGLLLASCAGGSNEPVPPPDVSVFVLPAEVEAEVGTLAEEGASSEGTYVYEEDEGVLRFTVGRSEFACMGPEEGSTFVVEVTELTATTMVWSLEGERVEFERVDDRDVVSVVGAWRSIESPPVYLFIRADGTMDFLSEEPACPEEDRLRNEESCWELVPVTATPVIDGDLSEWADAPELARLDDAAGDAMSDDPGADLRSVSVAIAGDRLFVHLGLHGPPSESFQARETPLGGTYRIQMPRAAADGGDITVRAHYSELEGWVLTDASLGAEVAAGPDGLEWSIPLDLFAPGPRIPIVLAGARDCGTPGVCVTFDELDLCGFVGEP